jgi:hypothetical protein
VDFEAFERAARVAFKEIPSEYRQGVDGLVVRRAVDRHPTLPGVFTLGRCLTEDHISEYGSPETTRSVIELNWGSFAALADRDPEYDWDGEIWETLTHELRHHLESLAREDALEGVDYAADETFKREEGLAFDPWYYQHGDAMGGGVYRVERSYYLEQGWSSADFDQAVGVEFDWHGIRYRVPKPSALGDIHFVWIEPPQGEWEPFELVLVRKQGWWENVRRFAETSRPEVHESSAVAEPVEDEG